MNEEGGRGEEQLLSRQGSWQFQLLKPLYESACGYPALSCWLHLSWVQYI